MTAALAHVQPAPRTATARSSRPTILGIQLLRATAATAVVIAHVQWDLTNHLFLPTALPQQLSLGNAGVDLFFVISGFVMVYSSEDLFRRPGGMREFLVRRIARIVPLYWLVTTLMLGYVLLRGFGSSDASPGLAMSSYLFIPIQRPSGEMGPLYGVGWTLNYEMFFYCLFALALLARRGIAVAALTAFYLALAVIHVTSGGLPLPFGYWSDPLILEFTFGMLLALAYQAGFRLPVPGATLLLIAAIASFAVSSTPWFSGLPRWMAWGIPSAFTVAALIFSSSPLRLAGAGRLGDASYALYLTHPMVIAAVRIGAQHGYLPPLKMPWLYLGGIVIASIALSVVVYERIEQPMTAYCRRALRSGMRPAAKTRTTAFGRGDKTARSAVRSRAWVAGRPGNGWPVSIHDRPGEQLVDRNRRRSPPRARCRCARSPTMVRRSGPRRLPGGLTGLQQTGRDGQETVKSREGSPSRNGEI